MKLHEFALNRHFKKKLMTGTCLHSFLSRRISSFRNWTAQHLWTNSTSSAGSSSSTRPLVGIRAQKKATRNRKTMTTRFLAKTTKMSMYTRTLMELITITRRTRRWTTACTVAETIRLKVHPPWKAAKCVTTRTQSSEAALVTCKISTTCENQAPPLTIWA